MPDRPILIIKLGALGNIVLSFRAFAAIRAHHPHQKITLLTTKSYAAWMREAPWFDEVLVDERPAWWNLSAVARLRRKLVEPGFERVYDLQTSSRSGHYFRLFPGNAKPEWSGIAPGCSHPDLAPDRNRLHDIDRLLSQLRQAGITHTPSADWSWCRGDIGRFALPRNLVALVPGSAPHRPIKRWPVSHYEQLAQELLRRGLNPIVLGSSGEANLAAEIPSGIDLTGQTTFGDLADIARLARFAVGNDTGPMHLLAAAGCRSFVLFSHDSDPALCAPRGAEVTVLRRPNLDDLPVEDVIKALPSQVIV